MRVNMQNSRTNRAAIFVYSYFLTARHASHYCSHATITSPLKATPPALAQKVLFLKIPSPCTFPIPFELKTKEEPKMNQGTPKELPTIKKCFLLRLLHWPTHLSWVLMLCTSPAKCLCQFPLHPFVKFLYTLSQVPKCHIADNQHLSCFGTPFE